MHSSISKFHRALTYRLIGLTLMPGMSILAMIVGIVVLLSVIASSASAKQAQSKLQADAFGLIYSDGSYEYDFVGLVDIQRARAIPCLKDRKVQFYRDMPDGTSEFIGSDRTNWFGLADLVLKHPDLDTLPGRYHGVLRPAKVRTRSGRLRCTGDRSRTITVRAPDFYQPTSGTAPTQARLAGAERRNDV